MRLMLVVLILFFIGCVQKEGDVKITFTEFSAKCGSGENFYNVTKGAKELVVSFGVNLPNPCYKMNASIENGNLVIKLSRSDEICIQCLAYGEGKVKVEGASDVEVQVILDDSKINLERK
ncbi:hypothetical protein Ferp_0165 [Ferroglobus placidus DSM 10642]|uniref:Lipoprotein n=1 Tax=Ferroglobus placidus (strain DSM 10642 / AEDII12DO) TaxID=589924 RepID=D3S1P5_FERPA|nr:hypothetical protein [Ferroglobus placidus]ADC64352.1 hypothetical protein Ferp_0165 [Ferroglobus placidus DSM 10642]